MPLQAPQWMEYLSCPVCENGFDLAARPPISLGCGHTVCQACLSTLQRGQCPFDQCPITIPLEKLPVNSALAVLIDCNARPAELRSGPDLPDEYKASMEKMERLASYLKPSPATGSQLLSRPMQRKLVALINTQLLEADGRSRAVRSARSLGERSVTELILQHQNPQQLSANLWAAVRARGCQFLGPAMQEEVLNLVLLALEDGSALSRKVLVMFVVQRLEPHFPQASKTSIGHVVQLLYRASCFKVTKRSGDSSLMQLKDEFRTYETLRREHDAQIVQIATEAGLRIAPDQWSSLLYGDSAHKSHMQSIIDKLQTPQSFVQSVQELVIALQRTGDPGNLSALRPHLDHLSAIDSSPDKDLSDFNALAEALSAACVVVAGLIAFIGRTRPGQAVSTSISTANTASPASPTPRLFTGPSSNAGPRFKMSMCRDLAIHRSCPRGKTCKFAHSIAELDQYSGRKMRPLQPQAKMPYTPPPPVAQVAPLPRGLAFEQPPMVMAHPPPQYPHQAMPMGPPMNMQERGDEAQQRAPPPIVSQGAGPCNPLLITKSLSALRSRKEEIIYKLEDIVGKDETNRISQISHERAACGKSVQMAAAAASLGSPPPPDWVVDYAAMWSASGEAAPWNGPKSPPEDRENTTPEDDVIPFSDTPQISRFGPISRRGATMMRMTNPSQSQAIMNDETMPTAVVRHSKPTPAAQLFFHSGVVTPVQTVVLDPSGQVGYIAVQPEGIVVQQQQQLAEEGVLHHRRQQQQQQQQQQHIVHGQAAQQQQQQQILHGRAAQQQPVYQQQHPPPHIMQPPVQILHMPQQQQQQQHPELVNPASVFAESERMKHELQLLQQKISSLNVAHHQQQQQILAATQQQMAQKQVKLASELQIIENTIKDREMELQMTNHLRHDVPRGLDYGSYVTHGLVDTDDIVRTMGTKSDANLYKSGDGVSDMNPNI